MTVGGFVTFHWRNGHLVPQRGSAEVADGAPFTCEDCGVVWSGNHEPPFDLEREPPPFEAA